jgi:hypothetical protein
LPPPPRRPQNSSVFSVSLARTTSPPAVTIVTETSWSTVRPYLRCSQPIPPQSESGDAGVSDDSRGNRETVSLGGRVELAQQDARLHSCRARVWVDRDRLHLPEIDHDPVVAGGVPWKAVPAASDRGWKTRLPRQLDRVDDLRRTRATRDNGRRALDRTVPDLAMLVVARVPGSD